MHKARLLFNHTAIILLLLMESLSLEQKSSYLNQYTIVLHISLSPRGFIQPHVQIKYQSVSSVDHVRADYRFFYSKENIATGHVHQLTHKTILWQSFTIWNLHISLITQGVHINNRQNQNNITRICIM